MDPNYYQCMYCNFLLPKANYDYLEHSCFANMDNTKENLYVNNSNQLYRLNINTQSSEEDAEQSENTQDTKQSKKDSESEIVNESTLSLDAKKNRGKEDKTWLDCDEILIEAVRSRPCLWNHANSVKNRSPLNVNEAWKEVGKELNDKFKIEQIKKRWRNLRDSFVKAKKKITEYIPSGSAAPSTQKKKDGFRYYEQMLFLNDCTNNRPSTSNVSMDLDNSYANGLLNEDIFEDVSCASCTENNDSDSTSGVKSFSRSSERSTKRQKNLSTEFQKDLLKILSETNKPPDGVDGFLLQLGDILRKLPYKNRRILQNKILSDALQAEKQAGIL